MTPLLVSRAKQLLRTGRLARPDRFASFGGPSAGVTCALCEERIAPGDLEIEVEWLADAGRSSMAMHPRCQGAWHVAMSDADGDFASGGFSPAT
jgi:hypothetical protein